LPTAGILDYWLPTLVLGAFDRDEQCDYCAFEERYLCDGKMIFNAAGVGGVGRVKACKGWCHIP
jgi:hypothetical protein